MEIDKMSLQFTLIFLMFSMYVFTLGKELESHGSPKFQKFFLQRQKRIRGKYEGDGQRADHDSESRSGDSSSACSPKMPSPQMNIIIRSSASIENGAKYLSARNGTSSLECFNLCCQDSACDTSIYEDKSERRCYLFDCHGLCKFKEHSHYVVWAIDRQAHTPPPKEEEEELAHLHSKDSDDDDHHDDKKHNDESDNDDDVDRSMINSEDDGDSSSSRKMDSEDDDDSEETPMPAVHNSKPIYVAPHTAGLSDFCQSDVSCEDPNAGCFGRACHCREGFYNKNGLCRKMCSHSNFECVALGTSGRGPECIPRDQICDSYMQCADGSDEFNCQNKVASNLDSVSRNNNMAASSSWMARQGVPNNNNNNNNNMEDNSHQMPVGTKQEGQQLHPNSPAINPAVNSEGVSTPVEKQGYNNYNNVAPPHAKTPQQGYGNMNQVRPSVRPINSMPAQPVKPNMNDRNQLPAKDNINNQHADRSFHNTNPNPANSQPSGSINKVNDNSNNYNNAGNNNNNNNNAFRGSPSQSNTFTGNNQDTNSYRNSYPERQNGPSQSYQSPASHSQEPNNPKASSQSQHQNPSSNVAYSESGPLPVNSGRNLNTDKTGVRHNQGKTQQYNSQLHGNSNTAFHASHMSSESKGRDGVKASSTSSQPQRIPSAGKNRVPSSLPKSYSSTSSHSQVPSKTQPSKSESQQNSVQSSKTKVSTSISQPAARPNTYPGSSLLSSSSSRQQQQPSHQGWLDTNPYLAYGSSGGSGNQRQRPQQMQPSRNSPYYDPSQYFSPYNTDSLDSLPPSLLGDTGPQDDFSSPFGSSYMDRQKQLNRMPYQTGGGGGGGGNTGYMGYPDSQYNSQYNPSGRYNYGTEFGGGGGQGGGGGGNYQDTDFYSSLRNTNNKGYQAQAAGLYEDDQTNHHLPSSGVAKDKGTYPPGSKASIEEQNLHAIHKSKSALPSDTKDASTMTPPSSVPKSDKIASTSSQNSGSESVKNKTKSVVGASSSSSSSSSVNGSKLNLTHPNTKKPHSSINHSSSNKVFLTQEKVIIASSTSEAEGPIIALSLGLAFTLILIGLLGCRLRNMKHRLRKGRPLNSNEADYLINGMYL